jgi:chromosome segregation ATPase
MSKATDLNEAVEHSRKFLANFGGLIKGAEFLASIASVERAKEESEARLAAALKGEADHKKKLEEQVAQATAEGEAKNAQLTHDCKNLEAMKLSRQAEYDALERVYSELAGRHRSLMAEHDAAVSDHAAFLRRFGAQA